jgi:hypothetical protein
MFHARSHHAAPVRHPLLGSRWHDIELSLPPGIAEVLAVDRHRAHLRFGPGRRAGEELDIELAELGRRFIRSHNTRGIR